jgi:cysteine desulfurase
VAGIVGFARAAEIAVQNMATNVARMTQLRDHFIARVLSEIDAVQLNGHPEKRLCNNININLLGARAETLLHALEERRIIVSSGSACHAGQSGPSQVLKSIGRTEKDTGCLRITLSRHSTRAQIDACADALKAVVEPARL